MEQLGSHWTDSREILCLIVFFFKSANNIQVSLKSESENGYLHEDQYIFVSLSVLTTTDISDKSCRENQNKHFNFNYFFFSKIVQFIR